MLNYKKSLKIEHIVFVGVMSIVCRPAWAAPSKFSCLSSKNNVRSGIMCARYIIALYVSGYGFRMPIELEYQTSSKSSRMWYGIPWCFMFFSNASIWITLVLLNKNVRKWDLRLRRSVICSSGKSRSIAFHASRNCCLENGVVASDWRFAINSSAEICPHSKS